jgi:hypothetical protein
MVTLTRSLILLVLLGSASAAAKRLPPTVDPLVGFNVMQVVSSRDGAVSEHPPIVRRVIESTEETSRSLTVELFVAGQTEGDGPTLTTQARVVLPAMEARRFARLSWSGATLTFETGGVDRMTHTCTLALPAPVLRRADQKPRPTRRTKTLRADCKPLGSDGATRPAKP